MTTTVRIQNNGPHFIIVGTPSSRAILKAGISETFPVYEHNPIVITEHEMEMNDLGSLVLPEGFRQ
jgi:hypothetical protein